MPEKSSHQPLATIPASKWQAFRPILQQKYEHENLTLNAVRDYMRETHNFLASPSQYQRAFNKWGFRKNAKRKDVEEIIISAKRKNLNLSQVTLAGSSVQHQERFQRLLRRYNTPGLLFGPQNPEPCSNERELNNKRLLNCNVEIACSQEGRPAAISPMFHIMPHIVSLPTFSLISHLGWCLPESLPLRFARSPLSLLTANGTSLKLSRLDTSKDALNLESIVYVHKVLNQTLDYRTSEELLAFIDQGSMDSMLRYMCRARSYLATGFTKNLLSICFQYWTENDDYWPQRHSALQRLVDFGIDGNIILPLPHHYSIKDFDLAERSATLLQILIAWRLFDLATSLLRNRADPNLCGAHGCFTDCRQLRCCEMLPIALLLEHSVENMAEEIEAAKLLAVMQTIDLVCCKALCLASVATHHCLLWFLTKSNSDPNALRTAKVSDRRGSEDRCWLSPLQSAIDKSNYEAVSMLLEAGAILFGCRWSEFEKPCAGNCRKCVHNHWSNKEFRSSMYSWSLFKSYCAMPPLSVASFRGDLAIIRLLLSTGAPINGCQLDIHCQKCCFSVGAGSITCQPDGNHCCCAAQCQISLKIRDLRSFCGWEEDLDYTTEDAFTKLQPWNDISKTGNKRQLADYSVYLGHSALQLAVVTSQQDLVHELIRCGADIEGCHGLTPLALAIFTGNTVLVDVLLAYGADPRGFCKNGPAISPFSIAAYVDDVPNMRKLLATGGISCYETSSQDECCPWEAAVRGESYGATSYLLSLQYSGRLVWDTGNATELICFSMNWSQWSLAKDFLERWCHMLTRDEIQDLLSESIRNAELAITAQLMALGVSVDNTDCMEAILRLNLKDAQHQRSFIVFILQKLSSAEPKGIIDIISRCGLYEINHQALKDVIYCLNTYYTMTAADTYKLLTILLTEIGDPAFADAAVFLLENGMYEEQTEGQPKMTGLQYAAQVGHLELVSRLMQLGANVNPDPAGSFPGDSVMTALQFAIYSQDVEVVELLLDHGADVNACGAFAVLQLAARSLPIDMDMIRLLLERGADVNALGADKQEPTALQHATMSDNTDAANMMLAKGADINASARGSFGRTALQASTEKQNHVLFRLFLDKGADVNAPPAPSRGVTALQAAAIVGNLEMCHTLVAAGAEIDAAGSAKHGRTAIEGAAEHGRLDVLSWLLNILVDQYRGHNPTRLRTSIQRAKEFAKKNKQECVVQFLEEFDETVDQKLSEIVPDSRSGHEPTKMLRYSIT